jgi:predicted nucleic-acid-binding Zn-ribbon protein
LRTATDNLLERILDMQSETDMVVTRLRGPFTEFFRHEK